MHSSESGEVKYFSINDDPLGSYISRKQLVDRPIFGTYQIGGFVVLDKTQSVSEVPSSEDYWHCTFAISTVENRFEIMLKFKLVDMLNG